MSNRIDPVRLANPDGTTGALLRQAADCATVGVAIADTSHRLMYVNPAFARMHGYDQSELTGIDERLLTAPDEVPKDAWQCNPSAKQWEGELPGLKKDGARFAALRTMYCVRGTDGEPAALLSIVRDITQTGRVGRQYRDLVENSTVAIYRSTLDGKFLYVNEAGAALFGASNAQELTRRSIIELYEDPSERAELIDRLKRDGSVPAFQVRMKTLGGEPLVVMLSATLVGDVLSGVLLDVTSQRRSEQDLQKTAHQLASLLESSSELNSSLDTQGVLRELVEHSMALVGSSAGAAGLVVDGSRVVLSVYNRRGEWMSRELTFEKGFGASGWVLEHGEPYLSNDPANDPQVIPHLQKSEGFTALLNVPIVRSDGELLGCVEVYDFAGERQFDEDDARLLTGLANQAAVALNNALLADNLRHYTGELERSEETLRLVVEGSPDFFFYIHGTDGVFSYISDSVEAITGHTPEEWKNHYTSFMTANPMNSRAVEFTERTLRTGEIAPAYPVEVAHRDGGSVVLEIYERPVFVGGEVVGIRGVARDITKARRAEELEARLREESDAQKRRFYRDTIFSVTDGKLSICDEEDIVEFCETPLFPPMLIKEPEDVALVRRQIRRAAAKAGMEDEQIDKLVLAVCEAGTNALKHAAGGTVCMSDGGGVLRVTVTDSGSGMDSLALPMITLRKGYSTQRSLGMGYAAILASADRVHLSTGPTGTVVAIEMAKLPSESAVRVADLPDLW